MNITIQDIQNLNGPLVRKIPDGRVVDTLKGRVIKQIVKDACFSAFVVATSEQSDEPVADSKSKLLDLEASTSPYKEGIDATLSDKPDNELFQLKPRKDLLLDLLREPEVPEESTEQKVQLLKEQAVEEFIIQRAKRAGRSSSNLAKQSLGKRVATGLASLDEDDGTHDEDFLTKASSFVIEFADRVFDPVDKSNKAYLQGVLAGIPADQQTSPDKPEKLSFDI